MTDRRRHSPGQAGGIHHGALLRLEQDGLIAAGCNDGRHPAYSFTIAGERQADVIAALAETMQAHPAVLPQETPR